MGGVAARILGGLGAPVDQTTHAVRAEVRAEMARQGLTAPAVAQALGLSRFSMWRKMHHLESFTEVELHDLAQLLEVRLDDLVPFVRQP